MQQFSAIEKTKPYRKIDKRYDPGGPRKRKAVNLKHEKCSTSHILKKNITAILKYVFYQTGKNSGLERYSVVSL